MKIKEKLTAKFLPLWEAANEKFFAQFHFNMKDANLQKIDDYMHEPRDSSSLAVTRILFGFAMLFDVANERGGAQLDKRWGDPNICHFPLFNFLQPLPMPYIALMYAGLWFGAIGIMLGCMFRFWSIVFTLCYWYLFLIEKSFWNNHSYLFGLVAFLMSLTEADCYWSVDADKNPAKKRTTVPYWNYFILKYQFFILYFMAGMKKGTAEWLSGYSMQTLSEHWVFWPFKLFLTDSQIDLYIVHWFIFVFDLTIAMWMMYSRTRHIAMFFCALFHLMNNRLFSIGMFPWVCLATMPLFYPFEWPKLLLHKINTNICCFAFESTSIENGADVNDMQANSDEANNVIEEVDEEELLHVIQEVDEEELLNENGKSDDQENSEAKNSVDADKNTNTSRNKKSKIIYFILFHITTQAFLPYSHFITQGYNNWTDGLYGYSWDMMVHSFDTHTVIIKVVDNEKGYDFYIDPNVYSPSPRWTRHGDMAYQYAQCLRKKIIETGHSVGVYDESPQNLSIYMDVWSSLNGRVVQRHFDSKVDMLQVEWSPFQKPSFLMPLLDGSLEWRKRSDEIRDDVRTWNNRSDVVFLADFPGYEQEKFITTDLRNVSLTILEGQVVYQPQVTGFRNGHSYLLTTGETVPVNVGSFHKVLNIGKNPAYYMYTFYNSTTATPEPGPRFPIMNELLFKLRQFKIFFKQMLEHLGFVMCIGKCE